MEEYDILIKLNSIVASLIGMAAEDAAPSDPLVNKRSPCLAVTATNAAVPTMKNGINGIFTERKRTNGAITSDRRKSYRHQKQSQIKSDATIKTYAH